MAYALQSEPLPPSLYIFPVCLYIFQALWPFLKHANLFPPRCAMNAVIIVQQILVPCLLPEWVELTSPLFDHEFGRRLALANEMLVDIRKTKT